MIIRFFLLLLLGSFSSLVTAAEVSLLYGTQGGGELEDDVTGTTLKLAEKPVRAVVIGMPYNDEKELELFYSRAQTHLHESSALSNVTLSSLDIHYLHAGGTVLSESFDGWQGFLSGGLGITHFSPLDSDLHSETRASMSVGVGARWMPTRNVGLRLETRLYGTLFNSNTSVFCSGGCVLTVSGDLLTQYAVFAGVVFRFE